MPRLRPAVIASKAPAGWLLWEESDLAGAGTDDVARIAQHGVDHETAGIELTKVIRS
jgi:hypothetical protein